MIQLAFSQRDPRWKDLKLGTSQTSTIGQYGCTITSIGAVLGLAPDEVNKRMVAANAFANEDLVIWTKLPTAFPNLQFIYKHYVYDEAVALESLRNGYIVLLEVDFDGVIKTPNDRHWVVLDDPNTLMDPWPTPRQGNLVSYNKYPIKKGFVVLRLDQKIPHTETLPKGESTHMDMTDTQRTAWEKLLQYTRDAKHGNEEGAINTLIDAATLDKPRLQADLNNANAEIRDLDARVRDLEKERGELQKTILDLKDRMSKQDQEDIDFGSQLLKAQNDLKHTEQALLKAEQEKDDANKTCDTVLQEMATKLSTTDTTITPHPTAILDALTDLKKQNEVLQTKVKQSPLDRYSIFERIASIIRSLFHQKGGDAQ